MNIPNWLSAILFVYMGSFPLTAPFMCSKLGVEQPFSNFSYLGISVFGLVCISFILSFGVPFHSNTQAGARRLARLRFISLVPQCIILLFLIGRVLPDENGFDKLLIIVAYIFSVISVVWSSWVSQLGKLTNITLGDYEAEEYPMAKLLLIKTYIYVSISVAITFLLGMLFSFEEDLPNYATIFGVLLAFVFWFGDKLDEKANRVRDGL
jgi:hypothetical protein